MLLQTNSVPDDTLPSYCNFYFAGLSNGVTHVRRFSRLLYRNVYEKIDMLIYGTVPIAATRCSRDGEAGADDGCREVGSRSDQRILAGTRLEPDSASAGCSPASANDPRNGSLRYIGRPCNVTTTRLLPRSELHVESVDRHDHPAPDGSTLYEEQI
jgi:hypothetical protein